jgi:hypothetical protein
MGEQRICDSKFATSPLRGPLLRRRCLAYSQAGTKSGIFTTKSKKSNKFLFRKKVFFLTFRDAWATSPLRPAGCLRFAQLYFIQ